MRPDSSKVERPGLCYLSLNPKSGEPDSEVVINVPIQRSSAASLKAGRKQDLLALPCTLVVPSREPSAPYSAVAQRLPVQGAIWSVSIPWWGAQDAAHCPRG